MLEAKNNNSAWVESLFDVSQPYLYALVLPALVLFALGYRRQAVLLSVGVAAFFVVARMA